MENAKGPIDYVADAIQRGDLPIIAAATFDLGAEAGTRVEVMRDLDREVLVTGCVSLILALLLKVGQTAGEHGEVPGEFMAEILDSVRSGDRKIVIQEG